MNIHLLYRPFQVYFRTRRMRRFAETFHPTSNTQIIDVGGYEFNWTLIESSPNVLMVNLERETVEHGRFKKVQGDGRNLEYPDKSFDIAYSNSVIEHVGDANDQCSFATEIRRVGRGYYVQTPYKWFPIEPHFITLGIQWLPRRVSRHLVRWLSVWGWITRPSQSETDAMLSSIRLLDKREMQRLFPDAEIFEEKFLGLTKSLIAVKTPHRASNRSAKTQ
jgi:hypothetical protein